MDVCLLHIPGAHIKLLDAPPAKAQLQAFAVLDRLRFDQQAEFGTCTVRGADTGCGVCIGLQALHETSLSLVCRAVSEEVRAPTDALEGVLVLGVPVHPDVATQRAGRLQACQAVHQRGLACSSILFELTP